MTRPPPKKSERSAGAKVVAEARHVFARKGESPTMHRDMDDPAFLEKFVRPTKAELDALAEKLVERRRKRLGRA